MDAIAKPSQGMCTAFENKMNEIISGSNALVETGDSCALGVVSYRVKKIKGVEFIASAHFNFRVTGHRTIDMSLVGTIGVDRIPLNHVGKINEAYVIEASERCYKQMLEQRDKAS